MLGSLCCALALLRANAPFVRPSSASSPLTERKGVLHTLDRAAPFTRRGFFRLTSSTALTFGTLPALATDSSLASGRRYAPLLSGPFDVPSAARATVREELVAGRVWTFDQVQGVIYVHVPVRMTVVKLDGGGLFVYAPVAPTIECLRLLSEVEAAHGPVRHILLPTLALEHKSFAGAFANARPKAQLWVAGAQYSFPLDLPLWAQGFPLNTKLLPSEGEPPPEWATQLPYRILGPLEEKSGKFQEVVCFDTATSSLLVTDLVVGIPTEAPAIVQENDERALLFHSRDSPADSPVKTTEALTIGWRKICLFALYFQSSPLAVRVTPDGSFLGATRFFRSAFPAEVPPDARALGWYGFIPWSWEPNWPDAFEKLRGNGKPLVAPILQVAVLNREPAKVLEFVERVANDFAFTSIVSCHFEPRLKAGPSDWSAAFDFLRKQPIGGSTARKPLPEADLAFLRSFEQQLVKLGSIRPAAPLA